MNANDESFIKCHCSCKDLFPACSGIIVLSLAFSACGPGGPGGPAFPGKAGGPWRHEGNSKTSGLFH